MTLSITFHGAAGTVTGSCMEIEGEGYRLLIDCGLFQGSRTLEGLNREPFGFDPAKVDALILTHAHIDHSGLLPRLVAEGFTGPIWCTAPTRDLLSAMLPDAGRIQESEAKRRNRRADRRDEPDVMPLYTEADAEAVMKQVRAVSLERQFNPMPGFDATLWNAGHILGSASVELRAAGQRLLFSGDIGPVEKAFHADPSAPAGFDHIICESTYGDRDRPRLTIAERRGDLEAQVEAAMARGGNLVIPAFAVERTQELLLDLASLINSGRLPHLRVFIDSPLADRITSVFARHARDLEDMGDGDVFQHPSFHFVRSVNESVRLNDMQGAVIIAASGMCEAGRIRHHLVHNLPDQGSTILFVGYQAQGTLGRAIVEGARRVRISGQDVAVRAKIARIDSYSAHADRDEIEAWVKARAPIAGSLFLSHGEQGALETLARELDQAASSVIVPKLGERFRLDRDKPATPAGAARPLAQAAVGRDWQNDYADFAANLKHRLREIDDAQARRDAVRRMNEVLQEFHAAQRQRRAR